MQVYTTSDEDSLTSPQKSQVLNIAYPRTAYRIKRNVLVFVFLYSSSSALYRLSSNQILLDIAYSILLLSKQVLDTALSSPIFRRLVTLFLRSILGI